MKKHIFILIYLLYTAIPGLSQYLSFESGIQDGSRESTMPERLFVNGDSQFSEVSYNFFAAAITEQNVDGELYNFLHIDGFAKMGQVGAPALPAHNEIIAMPKNAVGVITILESNYFDYPGFMIHPALKPANDTEGGVEPVFEKDISIYNSDNFFPEKIVEITNVGLGRGTPLAKVQVRPVQFNPVTGVVRVYTKISYRIDYKGGLESFGYIAQENSLHYTNLLKRNVLNSESIPDGISNSQSGSASGTRSAEKNYIIITHSEYLTEANELADWKRQLGYSVEVVSQSIWTATQVKTEIQTRYARWTPKPDYFLIIGNHTGSFAVPGEVHQDPNDGDDFATDLYYACMDGSGDWHPDMAHGRISVSSAIEAGVIVDKIIDYEKTPPSATTFYSNMLSCAQYQDDDNNGYADRRFCHTSEDIRDYLQDEHSYTSERVYYSSTSANVTTLRYNSSYYSDGQLLPSELRSASFDWGGGSSDITSAINSGKFLVFHRDHGYVGGSGWAHPYYTTTSMNSLSNGDELPVVFSMNCHTGEFQLSNCFAEKFLRMENKGAVGVVAAAYYSYSGYNDALSEGMIDAIWADPGLYPDFGTGGTGNNYTIGTGNDIYTMGDVVNQGLYAMERNWNGSSTSFNYQYELFHWFGDPAMRIWTDNPNSNVIAATHSSTIDCAGSTFAISGSTAGATATLVFNNELIGETVLDGSGNGSIPYSITSSGSSVVLTISKHNNYPYVSTLTVTGSCSFPPVANFSADIIYPELGQTVSFTDMSTNVPTSWLWSFTPSTVSFVGGTSATSQNPQVQFASVGDYTVQLTSTNAYGSDIESKSDYVTASLLMIYCSASGGTGDEYISGVQIGTINNTGTGDNGYTNYTSMSTNLTINNTYSIIITYGVAYSVDDLGIWIDWNQDGDFDDTNENVSCNIGLTYTQETYSIAVPYTALTGATTMRIRMKYWWGDCGSPCGATSYGEVEDYKINVLPGSNTWLGTNSEWNSTSNWSDGNVPNSSYEVTIPTGVTSPIIQTGTNAKCYSITLQTGATITINGNLEVEN